jgi:hypothetical protein
MAGYNRYLDPKMKHVFYVDTKAKPPRSIWTHPYEDGQNLRGLPQQSSWAEFLWVRHLCHSRLPKVLVDTLSTGAQQHPSQSPYLHTNKVSLKKVKTKAINSVEQHNDKEETAIARCNALR